MEHELITHYKEKGLIDDEIIFFIGMTELKSGIEIAAMLGTHMNPLERIIAVGLNNNTIRGFHMNYNHLTDVDFEHPFEEIKEINVVKKMFGKVIFTLQTEEFFYEYKVTANKALAYKIQQKFIEFKEKQNV